MGHGVHAPLSGRDDQSARGNRFGGGSIQIARARRLYPFALHAGHIVRSATKIEHHTFGHNARNHQVSFTLTTRRYR